MKKSECDHIVSVCWIYGQDDDTTSLEFFLASEIKKGVSMDGFTDLDDGKDGVDYKYFKHCPECGEKLDGKTNNR